MLEKSNIYKFKVSEIREAVCLVEATSEEEAIKKIKASLCNIDYDPLINNPDGKTNYEVLSTNDKFVMDEYQDAYLDWNASINRRADDEVPDVYW